MNTPRTILSGGLALTLLLAPGCLQLQSDEEKEAALEAQVMRRHDALMARMDELYQLRQQLTKRPDTAATAPHRRALLAADAAMMGWMHQYRRPADTTRHERALAYYRTQLGRIDSVGGFMERTIDSARAVLAAPAPR